MLMLCLFFGSFAISFNVLFEPIDILCFFRRKRGEKAAPLVVEESWPVKKARITGSRKKRSDYILFQSEPELPLVVAQSVAETEPELQLDNVAETEPDLQLDNVAQTEPDLQLTNVAQTEHHELQLENVEQPEHHELHLEVAVQSEPILQVAVESKPILEAAVQSELVRHVKLGGPSEEGKKTKSINQLCGVEDQSGKKQKKLSGKKQKKK